MIRILLFLLVCLPLISSCSSSGVMPGEFGIDHFGGGGGGPMGLITCDDFYSGVRGELWTTNTMPEFHVLLEKGDGYIPTEDDFAAYVDEVQVKVKLNGPDDVSFQPVKPLEPGIHNIAITFWPPKSYPQARALTFDVCTQPAKITACLGNEEKGYYLMFFDKPLNQGITESKLNWSITDFPDVFSNIELINGGLTAVVSVYNDMLPDMKSAPSIEFRFNGSRGLSTYTQKNPSDRSGERYGQAPPPDCICDTVVSYRDEHSYEESEHNAYCFEVEFNSPNPCNTKITWRIETETWVHNADPWDVPWLMEDPEDLYDPLTTTYDGGGILQEGFYTLKFNKDANWGYLAAAYADCIPEDEPGGKGYETFKKYLSCSFSGADTEPPEFKNGTPLLLTGPEAADAIIDILDEYDNPDFGEAHYIAGREGFLQGVELLRDDPCKLVILAFAKDTHNLRGYNGQYSPFALEYKELEEIGMGTMGVAYMARFDEYPIATDEYVSWPDPAYNKEYDNDGRAFNEYELNYWVLNDQFGSDLSGLADAEFLRVRVEDHTWDNAHGNWRRSGDLLPEALEPQIFGIKAYQQFQDPVNQNDYHYVEADYEDGPTFARNVDGWTDIDFAVAVLWHGIPPDSVHILATNSSDPHLPPGCDVMSGFYTYRLKDRLSDKYLKLCDLFGLTPVDCMDFYMRGSGLTYQGDDISPEKLVVTDDVFSTSQDEEWALGDCPVLYMSHRDHHLLPEDRDDYSFAQACEVEGAASAYSYGDMRGEYDLDGDMLNVFSDLKLGGAGKLTLWNPDCHTVVPVQSGGDLFVMDAHGDSTPHFCYFRRRQIDGSYSTCNPGDPSNDYWTTRFRPFELDSFTATDWLITTACWQLNDYGSWATYKADLIDAGRLIGIGGYGTDQYSGFEGSLPDAVTVSVAPFFNQVMESGLHLQSDTPFWFFGCGGDKFMWAWMESHCMVAREQTLNNLAVWILGTRAIDSTFLYTIEVVRVSNGWGQFADEYFIFIGSI